MTLSFYLYDGHGTVRQLADEYGVVTDTYAYDAFGVLLDSSGTTENDYLYTGEQYDADLGMYFLRARYLNTETGRFHSQDSYEGRNGDPLTLHKYVAFNNDPVMFVDPSGNISLTELSLAATIGATFNSLAVVSIKVVRGEDIEYRDIVQAAVVGAVGGATGIGSVRLFARITWPLLRVATAGAFAGATGQLLTEIIDYKFNGKELTVRCAGNRVAFAAIGGFVVGGLLHNVKITNTVTKTRETFPAISTYDEVVNVGASGAVGGGSFLQSWFTSLVGCDG